MVHVFECFNTDAERFPEKIRKYFQEMNSIESTFLWWYGAEAKANRVFEVLPEYGFPFHRWTWWSAQRQLHLILRDVPVRGTRLQMQYSLSPSPAWQRGICRMSNYEGLSDRDNSVRLKHFEGWSVHSHNLDRWRTLAEAEKAVDQKNVCCSLLRILLNFSMSFFFALRL